jgi:hypothetical protein
MNHSSTLRRKEHGFSLFASNYTCSSVCSADLARNHAGHAGAPSPPAGSQAPWGSHLQTWAASLPLLHPWLPGPSPFVRPGILDHRNGSYSTPLARGSLSLHISLSGHEICDHVVGVIFPEMKNKTKSTHFIYSEVCLYLLK